MKSIQSEREFSQALNLWGDDVIYRGQVKHYTKDNTTSITTSFKRNGCHPPSMQRWLHYCGEALHSLNCVEDTEDIAMEWIQALLQHYGWRSFYIDVTKDISVAAWFACNVYESKNFVNLEEDCNEVGVLSIVNKAHYVPSVKDGYIYVISKNALNKCGVGVIDLCLIEPNDFKPRYSCQKGLLIGPCDELPPETILDVLKVDLEVLKSISKQHALDNLFPGRDKDVIYKILLSVPFTPLPSTDSSRIAVYRRALQIPEYDFRFTKINSSNVAYYSGEMIFKEPDEIADIIVHASGFLLYHTTIDIDDDISGLLSLLGGGGKLIVECSDLLRLPPFHDSPLYIKGAHLQLFENGDICISGMSVQQSGTQITSMQIDNGWYYRQVNNRLIKVPDPRDCPCNYKRRHLLIVTILKKANLDLVNGKIFFDKGIYHY
ncbi:FRG domain-containing protein [Prosthecobacter sp. SYSU 5D2]|uniref:FRG domain-containing protein n=1 Tax=Prosthecobacter sp. SYSU 5D2 TaxID=3134134 RepID=UPI0031FECE78